MQTPVLLVVLLSLGAQSGTAKPAPTDSAPAQAPAERKADYVRSVTRGGGLMPWQEAGTSEQERSFRASIEKRKDELLAARVPTEHPAMISPDQLQRARQNIKSAAWAGKWAQSERAVADFLVAQPDDYAERMISELSPTNTYGFTCPNCVGRQSQEGSGTAIIDWDYRHPDQIACKRCRHVYPSSTYPETATLHCPRAGQTFTYYLNDGERAKPEDRSGAFAWHWVSRPIHVSFSGQIRTAKAVFMGDAVATLATQYALTGDVRYATCARRILVRMAHCYRRWLYHDYWDTIADCDPMYAAWHDQSLALEWKRHLCEQAFAKDSVKSAAMLRDYWGAGRLHSSCDGIHMLSRLALAYDLVYDAKDAAGSPAWSPAERAQVERDLLLEYAMGAEHYLGGAGQAACVNNKSPAIYHALAVVGRSLGLANYVDVALRGYEGIRDRSFLYDGFSKESVSYTGMYLGELVQIPEQLDGFQWPKNFRGRQGAVDLFRTDARLRLMFRAMCEQSRPDGRYPPLSDTHVEGRYSARLVEMGLKRYPEHFRGKLPAMLGKHAPSTYAVFNLTQEEMDRNDGLNPPEIYFPAWMTAFLRHGQGPGAAMIAMPFSPDGPHRHYDNLALFYTQGDATLLGDQGYMGDMPLTAWIKSSFSHNLVIVDDQEQRHSGRKPQLGRMFTTPEWSVVEAASNAYPQCREYSRLVALIKGPEAQTFAVDVFRVKGGKSHRYRVFSELAASDAVDGSFETRGVTLPPEPPLPKVGASLAREDVFGLRDVRASAGKPPATWQAVWKQKGGQYRMWMVSPTDRVEASNGPGQETFAQAGRRVRYVDAIREGPELSSTFVVLHEPGGHEGSASTIQRAELLPVPAEAGPDAIAVQIETRWGRYVLLNRFSQPVRVADCLFQGELALVRVDRAGKTRVAAQGVATFERGGLRITDAAPVWSGKVVGHDDNSLRSDTPRPDSWAAWPENVQAFAIVQTEEGQTGWSVSGTDEHNVRVDRFPLPECNEFRLENLRVAGD